MRNAKIKHFATKWKLGNGDKFLGEVLLGLCEAVNTPRSLTVWILYKSKEFAQLVDLEVNPLHYKTAHSFADDYLVSSFLSKYPHFKHADLDPVGKAKKSFVAYELQCKETNKRINLWLSDQTLFDPSVSAAFRGARRKIRQLLGDAPNFDSIAEGFGWGPGATSVSTGQATAPYVKYAQRLDVTSNGLIFGRCCVNSSPSWVGSQLETDSFPSVRASVIDRVFNIVRGNEVLLVPKKASTHRVIAKEPHVLSYAQKGFGREIRRRLSRVGVDLRKGQPWNQRAAHKGSLTGSLATLDLKGASDTISKELVRYLLPTKWFHALNLMRSPQGLFEGQWIEYEKFSSMGNAYTFELESLIFYSLVCASLELGGHETREVHVYGDDLIVPTDGVPHVVQVLEAAGFSLNTQKSFSSGVFRESCGADFFGGTDVRPIFLKERLTNAETIYRLANRIRRYAHRRNFGYGCDVRFASLHEHIVSHLPKELRQGVPEGFGDIGLIMNLDEARPHRAKHGLDAWQFVSINRRANVRKMWYFHSGFTAALAAIEGSNPSQGEITTREASSPRDSILLTSSEGNFTLRDSTHIAASTVITKEWYDLGPWV